jgi:hypothetical protein
VLWSGFLETLKHFEACWNTWTDAKPVNHKLLISEVMLRQQWGWGCIFWDSGNSVASLLGRSASRSFGWRCSLYCVELSDIPHRFTNTTSLRPTSSEMTARRYRMVSVSINWQYISLLAECMCEVCNGMRSTDVILWFTHFEFKHGI